MPTFCRHNRFLANCPICSREHAEAAAPRPAVRSKGGHVTKKRVSTTKPTRSAGDLHVRRIAREREDGYRSPLVPGLKASGDAERLAEELAFATARLVAVAASPPGLYAEVASGPDREEAWWLAFLIAYLGPLDDGEDPFAGIRAARTSWASGELPDLDGIPLGPRTAHDPARGGATLAAYRAWAERAGSQAAAFAGEPSWTPERRFARLYERLALPGLHRDARYELLATAGPLGLAEVQAGTLVLGGMDETTVAAKRVFGIGDTLLLERRAKDLAQACAIPLAALDVGLWNWSRPVRQTPGAAVAAASAAARPTAGLARASAPATAGRTTFGLPDGEPDADLYARVAEALGL